MMKSKSLWMGPVLATAIATHMLNRAYCDYLGDDSQKPWDDAPEWQRESAVKGVEFHLSNPDASPSASHDSWMAQKLADGWVYGEVKDENKKTHPCIVPFDQLPQEQQLKDVLFRAQVHSVYRLFRYADDEIEALGNPSFIDGDVVEIEDLTKERDAAIARADAAEKKLAAKPKAVSAKPAEPRARKFKPIADGDRLSQDDLREKLLAADDVEIVQVDKRGHEIPGSQPLSVSGEVWKPHALGLMLANPVEFQGGETAYHLAGYALLIDGKQVALQMRSDPFNVNPRQSIKLVDDIAF